jgi:parallel beta-helix repeat protein
MRKCYSVFLSVKVLFFLSIFLVGQLKAQVTVSTPVPSGIVYVSDTEPGVVIFGIRNTNAIPITITGIGAYLESVAGTGTYSLWYHPTAVTGAPSAITVANGWVKLAPSGTVTPVSNSVIPLITGLSLTVPSNTTYRLAIEGPIHAPYYGTAGSTGDLFSGGGLLIYAQANSNSPTYAGTFPSSPTSFTPRSFYGTITFVPAGSCIDPPTAGTPVVPALACIGSNITLDLTGNTIGTGQTYQWQYSTDDVNWTDVGPASPSQILNTPASPTGYYRARITCGATTVNSTSAFVPASAPLSGTYTINSANPTNGTNFQNFTDAVARLSSCGVINPVTFNVASGSGPYNEQITIPQIIGASSTNTVTFNCNDVTIQATPVTDKRHIVQLNGADYVTISNLKIQAITGSTYGWGIHLTNDANRNTIQNCTIDMSAVTSTTQANSGCIVGSGTMTSVTADGSASNNIIRNNTIIGGYQGIIMNGATGSVNAVQNMITGNMISDFYANGIELTDNDGSIVSNNDISRSTRVAVTTFTGIELGAGNINCVVNANRIHDTHNAATTQSGTAYGISSSANDAIAGSENKITNNLVYNLNSTTGTQYGLYNSSSDGARYYHNTVVLSHPGSTAGITRGFYQTGVATNIDIKNNIIYIARGGTGVKYALYFGTNTSTITSNNNILFNASSAGTNGIGSFGTAGSATLADWQAANGAAYDQQSINIDPQFTNPCSGK